MWLASFESLSTVLPPLATTTRCRPPKMGLFACPIPPWFVLSNNLLTTNTRAIWLCFGAFLSPPASSLQFHWLLATDHHSPVPRSTPGPAGSGRAQTPHWLLPDSDRRFIRDRTGSNLDERRLYIQYVTKPGDSRGKINPLLLARHRRPLTILSWPEALNASRSKRACRMAIRRNACSLLALPDFPEFAQAVRYGVPGTQVGNCFHANRHLTPALKSCFIKRIPQQQNPSKSPAHVLKY